MPTKLKPNKILHGLKLKPTLYKFYWFLRLNYFTWAITRVTIQ